MASEVNGHANGIANGAANGVEKVNNVQKVTENGNGHLSNGNGYAGKTPIYQTVYPLETSYSTTRQRVFVETGNEDAVKNN